MSESNNNNPTCKICFVGESGVGCNCLTIRYVVNEFKTDLPAVNGHTYKLKTEYIEKEDKYVNFEIWNGPGQAKYRSLTKFYIKDVDVCVLVYDIKRKETFDEIKDYWFEEIKTWTKKDISKKY